MENSGEISEHIRETRQALGDNLHAFEGKVKEVANWRVQFERHPGALLGFAFGAGLLLAAVRSSPAKVHLNDDAKSASEASQSGSRVWADVKSAVGSAVSAQIYAVLGEVVPALIDRRPLRSQGREPQVRNRNGHDTSRYTNPASADAGRATP